ncbi:hypothetical protein JHK86_028236 [Glycine max]|nr:hypothetical protein JHK86_028236 [Glycine max]
MSDITTSQQRSIQHNSERIATHCSPRKVQNEFRGFCRVGEFSALEPKLLVNVYVSFGSLQHAFLTFCALLHKPNIAWNAILRGLVGVGHFTKAIHFSHSMLQHEVTPDNYTYPLLLKACSSLRVLELGRWVHDTMLYNELHCKTKANWLEALLLFGKMREQGLMPDSVIVASVLPVCGRLEAVKLGMALQGCAVRSGFESDLYFSFAMIDMYCKCGDPFDAHRVFSRMVYKDVVSWSTLIVGYS